MSSGPKLDRADRHRPSIELTLAPETHERLEEMARRLSTSKSAVIDKIVSEALMPRDPT